MNKGETIFQRVVFRIILFFTILVPPVASFRRIEALCLSWLHGNPMAYTPRKVLAGLYSVDHMAEKALREFTRLKELGYLTDKDKVNFAEVLLKLKDFQGVVELLVPVSEKHPDGYRTNRYLGRAYLLMGQAVNGAKHYERVIGNRQVQWDDYKDLGICYFDLKRYEEALENLQKALALNPQSQAVREMIGAVFSQRGKECVETDLVQAEEDLTKSLEYCPTSQAVRTLLNKVQELRRG